VIDTSFDFRSDSAGRDPDKYSPTLRDYHRQLWSKALRSGEQFELDDRTPGAYLHHQSDLGEFFLSSDTVVPTYGQWARMKHITAHISEKDDRRFHSIRYTIGGMLIFPSNVVDRKPTINGARGFDARISDRIDLTLESIRRHYRGEVSPLAEALARYASFFELFGDFDGYLEFFLLRDLVDERSMVRFMLPFDDFRRPAVPTSVEEYRNYARNAMDFLAARNRRIASVAGQTASSSRRRGVFGLFRRENDGDLSTTAATPLAASSGSIRQSE
jgi:hypothetical protein